MPEINELNEKKSTIVLIISLICSIITIILMWNMVILIYIAGLSYGIKVLFDRNTDRTIKSIVFLSILGLGIFSYFQSRSYDGNLFAVCYPAILILTIFMDKLLRQKVCFRFIAAVILSFFIF